MTDLSTCAHLWRVASADADPGSPGLPATCAHCGASKAFPRALPIMSAAEAFNGRRHSTPKYVPAPGTRERLNGDAGRHAHPAPLGRRDPSARYAS